MNYYFISCKFQFRILEIYHNDGFKIKYSYSLLKLKKCADCQRRRLISKCKYESKVKMMPEGILFLDELVE